MNQILDPKVYAFRTRLEELAKDIHHLTIMIDHDELSEIVSNLRNRIHEPFMFVIVGEVKAGKSSFINALLDTGREITRVAPQPMTDTIQQIVYGDVEDTIMINPFLKRITLPVEILKEIAIVDTPGTNTIIEKHQDITESFIPGSDLIVFVFESKNPYRQSAWDFLNYIHGDWKKKIIFVLQQKDLIDPLDLQVNMNGVREQAEKKGMMHPMVFAVSAKLEQEGNKSESGFVEVRKYITENITGGRAPYLKLQNSLATLDNIHERINTGFQLRKDQFLLDTEFRQDVTSSLDQQQLRSGKHVDMLIENILNAFDAATKHTRDQLDDGLSFGVMLRRSFTSIFNKKTNIKTWLKEITDELEYNLNNDLRKRLNEGVGDVAESIQQMAKIIQLKVQNSKTILKDDQDIFSDIAEKRNYIMQDLQQTFNNFLNNSDNFNDQTLFPDQSNVSGSIAAGSGIAVLGIILAAVTHGAVFDVTGGLLTTIGVMFAGVTTVVKKRKIMDNFDLEIKNGRDKLEIEINENLKAYIDNLRKKIEENFRRFDAMLINEEKQIKEIDVKFNEATLRLKEAETELAAVLK
ncbi:MAG TPA: dynamin family protein [Saprospiraceae bacterium]|nr:dynamin family protein [Saprospiraceae bacterium]